MTYKATKEFQSEFDQMADFAEREKIASERIKKTYALPYVRASKWSDSSYVDANISSVINKDNVTTGVLKKAKLANRNGGTVMNFYNSVINITNK